MDIQQILVAFGAFTTIIGGPVTFLFKLLMVSKDNEIKARDKYIGILEGQLAAKDKKLDRIERGLWQAVSMGNGLVEIAKTESSRISGAYQE